MFGEAGPQRGVVGNGVGEEEDSAGGEGRASQRHSTHWLCGPHVHAPHHARRNTLGSDRRRRAGPNLGRSTHSHPMYLCAAVGFRWIQHPLAVALRPHASPRALTSSSRPWRTALATARACAWRPTTPPALISSGGSPSSCRKSPLASFLTNHGGSLCAQQPTHLLLRVPTAAAGRSPGSYGSAAGGWRSCIQRCRPIGSCNRRFGGSCIQ